MSSTRVFSLILALIALCSGGCSMEARIERQQRRAAKKPPAKVWLVSNGWHTSIALRTADATPDLRAFAPDSRYLVIGWGGADFYMWRNMDNPWRMFTSLVLPTSSALHVIPIKTTLVKECPNSEIIEFDVTEQGLERLRHRLLAAFKRDPAGKPLVAGQGKLPRSKFFDGTETYFFPKTCNLWVASQLRLTGVPIRVTAAIVADNLCWQGRKHGRLLAVRTAKQDQL